MKKKHELYTMPAFAQRWNKTDQAFWTKDTTIILLIVGLSLLDAVTLYTVYDALMYQSQAMSVILTVGTAVTLNFMPLIAARFLHYYRYHIHGVRMWMLTAMGCVFLVLFVATFNLRWQTREMSFSGPESSMIDTTGQASGIESPDSESKEAVAITILLGILPGVTSAINLALGYFNDDPVKRKLEKLKVELAKLREQQDIMQAARSELEQEWLERLTELDQERCQATCASIQESTAHIKAAARLELAKRLGDPDSISALTEPKLEPLVSAEA